MKLSVFLITYNHEHFIAQAIEGILMQKVNFDYEIVIGEDCSTDNTRTILLDYQSRYPEKIRLLLAEKNRGMMNNVITTFEACKGEYIATLEGDDFWTDPDKLQKQVNLLDSNPTLSCCFHNVVVKYEDQDKAPHPFHMQLPLHDISTTIPKPVSTLDDIVPGNFLQSCTIMYRNGLFGSLPDWYATMPIGDWPLNILNAQHGNIGYIDEIMATYRVHKGGVWSSNMSHFRKLKDFDQLIYCYKTINRHLNFKYNKVIKKKLAKEYWKAINLCASLNLKGRMIAYTGKYLSAIPLAEVRKQGTLFKLFSKTLFPWPFKLLRSVKLLVRGKPIRPAT